MRILHAAGLAVCLATLPAGAAEIAVVPPSPMSFVSPVAQETMEGITLGPARVELSPRLHIHIAGPIARGDAARLEEMFLGHAEQLPFHEAVISLDSDGGSFHEGLLLGDLIHRLAIPTLVLAGDRCLSACAIAFMAGNRTVIRGVASVPDRRVHLDGDLGFHAPFLDDRDMRARAEYFLGDGADIEDALDFAAEMFTVSRDLVRRLNERSAAWRISPALTAQFLGYGPKEFFRIDTLERAKLSSIDFIAEQSAALTRVTIPDAIAACQFKQYVHLGAGYDYSAAFVTGPGDRDYSLGEPVFFPHEGLTELEIAGIGSQAPLRLGDGRIEIDLFIPGRGNYRCDVRRGGDGRWAVDLAGDYHPDRAFGQILSNPGALVVTDFVAAGAGLARTGAGFDRAARDYVARRLRMLWPDEAPRADGAPRPELKPSYSCAARLSPAEQLICDMPVLAHADAMMAERYKAARERDPAVKASQRAWLAAREAFCQTGSAELELEVVRLNQARCLLGAMLTRIEALDRVE